MGDYSVLLLGLILLAGYAAHALGRRAHVPRVTLLLLLGLICGPAVLGLIPAEVEDWFPFITRLALAMVGFLLGERLATRATGERGRVVLGVSLAEASLTAVVVFVVVLASGASLPLAILLAGIAPASAPAATLDTARESGAEGPVTDTVLGVVAVDDGWGVILFSVLLVLGQSVTGTGAALSEIGSGVWEVAGGVLLGGALGVLMAWVTGRLREGEPTLPEAMGFVLLCAGAAELLNVSYLLACMALGVVLARRARHHTRPVHAIEGVSDPFLVVFFVIAGLKFELDPLLAVGAIGAAYIGARVAGKVAGVWVGGALTGASDEVRRHVGLCLLPQAGVALGLALLAEEAVPSVAGTVLPLIIATTVIFEITGPLMIRWQLRRAGEIG